MGAPGTISRTGMRNPGTGGPSGHHALGEHRRRTQVNDQPTHLVLLVLFEGTAS